MVLKNISYYIIKQYNSNESYILVCEWSSILAMSCFNELSLTNKLMSEKVAKPNNKLLNTFNLVKGRYPRLFPFIAVAIITIRLLFLVLPNTRC